jgi:hypothetical protein
MRKRSLLFIIACMIFMAQIFVLAQDTVSSKKQTAKSAGESGESVTHDDRIPLLYKRLVAAVQVLKQKPDGEGKYTFVINNGNQYDLIDRVFLVYNKRAMLYMSNNSVSKIVFEYYQYNMTTQLREVKTYTCATPDSDNLGPLVIEYAANTGEKEKYTVNELKKPESQKIIIKQFHAYYFALVNKLELYNSKTTKLESSKVNRTIQLGD